MQCWTHCVVHWPALWAIAVPDTSSMPEDVKARMVSPAQMPRSIVKSVRFMDPLQDSVAAWSHAGISVCPTRVGDFQSSATRLSDAPRITITACPINFAPIYTFINRLVIAAYGIH